MKKLIGGERERERERSKHAIMRNINAKEISGLNEGGTAGERCVGR